MLNVVIRFNPISFHVYRISMHKTDCHCTSNLLTWIRLLELRMHYFLRNSAVIRMQCHRLSAII